MTTHADKSPRSYWILFRRWETIVMETKEAILRAYPNPENPAVNLVHVIEASAYLAVKQELKNAKSALRCGECGNVGMFHHGLQMQDTINKLQQELDAARSEIAIYHKGARTLQLELADAKAQIENLKYCHADACADIRRLLKQIKDYEAALEEISKPITGTIDPMYALNFGIEARRTLNKWRAK